MTLSVSCNDGDVTETPNNGEDENTPEEIDYGTLSIADVNVVFKAETLPIPVFSNEEYEEEIEYTFEGSNISIVNGVIKGLGPDTTTEVTAKTEHHKAKFNVNVSYVSGVLNNTNGD